MMEVGMRFSIIAAGAVALAAPSLAHPPAHHPRPAPVQVRPVSDAPVWYGRDIAATAYDIPVRDLTGRNVVPGHPYFLPPRRHPRRGYRPRTIIVVPSGIDYGGYYPHEVIPESVVVLNSRQAVSTGRCPAASSGPPSADSAIAAAAHASGEKC
jgi:hypothetical protein